MKLKAFTLAEVLITLAIIGIVAALTIPSVISNYQQQEFKTGLKKAVSVLNEAIQTNIAQEGETPYENEDLFSYLKRHMNILKTGGYSVCYNGNGSLASGINDGNIYRNCQQGEGTGDKFRTNNVFYTTDGMRFELPAYVWANAGYGKILLHETGISAMTTKYNNYMSAFCGSYGLANNSNKTINTPCVIMVDVNGDKKPNPPKPMVTDMVLSHYRDNEPSPHYANFDFTYTYPSPSDKKLQDVFNILITEEKAIPFGVVAQRAMYSK